MVNYHIITVIVKNKATSSIELQKILSLYGDLIRTRLGINETKPERDNGLIILHAEGDKERLVNMVSKINASESLKAEMMSISSE